MKNNLTLNIMAVIAAIFLLASCASVSTRTKFYEPIRADLYDGDYQAAVAAVEQARAEDKYAKKDRFLYYLDAGLAYHFAREYDSSNVRLHAAEETNDELYAKSVSQAVLSFALNDNVIEYRGEDYEVLYTNLFKALNYLELGDFEAAFVEIRRANLKLEQLEQKHFEEARVVRNQVNDSSKVKIPVTDREIEFSNSAFARYLSMHMYAASGNYDDAEIDKRLLQEAFSTQPQIYNFSPPEVQYESDRAILSVVALAGTSPIKKDFKLRLRTDKQLDIVQILIDGRGKDDVIYWQFPAEINADYYFKFAIPTLKELPSEVSSIGVWSDGKELGRLQLIEDIGAVAKDVYEARESLILIKTLARALAKGLLTHEIKEDVKDEGIGGWLLKAAVDAATDFTENADLRCSHLLPGKIYVGDFEIEPGTYNLEVLYFDDANNLVSSTTVSDFDVNQGAFNMIEAFCLK